MAIALATSAAQCARWCNESLIVRNVNPLQYHTDEDKCSWSTCSQCAMCSTHADTAAADTAVPAADEEQWHRRNLVTDSPLLQVLSYTDYRRCLGACTENRLCTAAVWNCDATCYLMQGRVEMGREEECTFSYLKGPSHSCNGTLATIVHNAAIRHPPTICCAHLSPTQTPVRVPRPITSRVLVLASIGTRSIPNVRSWCLAFSKLTNVDFFAVHYDRSGGEFSSYEWFESCVLNATTIHASVKTRIFQDLFEVHRARWLAVYSHVWMLDEDITLPPPAYIAFFLERSVFYDILIAQPAIIGSVYRFLEPDASCAIRLSTFVEIMAPLIRIDVFHTLMRDVFHPDVQTDWGLDVIWCEYAKQHFGSARACAIINAGIFTHALSVKSANYSRQSAVVDESCMRARYQRFVAAKTILSCLEPDAYGSAEGVLRMKARTTPFWPSEKDQRALRLFLYDTTEVNRRFCTRRSAPSNNFEWEAHLSGSLTQIFHTVEDPDLADFYFLPACLNVVWSTSWIFRPRMKRKLVCNLTHTRAYETELVRVMQKAGRHFQTRPEKHLIPRHKCPLRPDHAWNVGAGDEPYPYLWLNNATRFVCIETTLETTLQSHPAHRDMHREVHIPYYMDIDKAERPIRHRRRRHVFGFAGSMCCMRGWLRSVLENTSVVAIADHLGSSYTFHAIRKLLRWSAFAIQPPGDTPERRNIYEAMVLGTPNLFPHAVAPPLRYQTWKSTGYDLRVGIPRVNDPFVSDFLRHYNAHVQELVRDRRFFLWRSLEFLDRLRDIVVDVMA